MLNNRRVAVVGVAKLGANIASTKVLASLALVAAAASIAGLGTYATFTSSTPAQDEALTSGTLQIALGASGTSANRLAIGASDIAPGDTIQRTVDLSNTASTVALGGVSLTTAASPSSALDTDATNGLQMAVDNCSVAWTETGPPYVYTCSGTTSSVLASQPVIGSGLSLSNVSLAAGAVNHLRVTLTLPTTGDDSLQGLASTIAFTFTGTQRAGISK